MAVEYDANGTPILTNDSLISDVPPYTQAIAANGGTLVPSSLLVPAGALMPFAGQDAPDGWLLCHGQSLDVATYQVLWDAIGYRYGGSGASFNLPDLRGRVPAGQDNMGGTSANRLTSGQQGSPTWSNGGPGDLGATCGLDKHKLSINEMPRHNHNLHENSGNSTLLGGHYGGPPATLAQSSIAGGGGSAVYVTLSGNDYFHNNTQPSIILTYIIKS